MFKTTLMSAALALAAASGAHAETIEVKMLNRGESGMMVFEPAFVAAEIGDVIRFVPVDNGHNVESIEGMLPEDVEPFKTAFDEEFELTVAKEGVYGIKCTPHYTMGMVALIQAGAPANIEEASAVQHKAKARPKMAELLSQVE